MPLQSLSADWIFPVSSPPLFGHALEFENGIIRALRPARGDDPKIEGACLLPGLVNAHTHLAYTALRNQFDDLAFFPWIRRLTELKYNKLTAEDLALSTRLGIYECLRAGITTVADLSDCESGLAELSRSPLRGIFYWEVFGVEQEHAQRTWTELQQTFPRLLKQYVTNRLRIGISPHAIFTVRPELYRRIAGWSIRENIPVSFHVAESRDEEEFVATRGGVIGKFLEKRAADWEMLGSSSVSHLEKTGILDTRPLLAHLVQASGEDFEILARHDVSVAHCPKSNAKFAHGIAPLTELRNHGLRVGLGTDSAASNNRLDLFEEGRFALLQQRSRDHRMNLTEAEVLAMMTLDGARAMGLEETIGSLESGKAADFIAVTVPSYYTEADQLLRHLVHNATSMDVAGTWIAGTRVAATDPGGEIREFYRRSSLS
ncbi:MAG TPA: amidohydrolase family protein [Acidobacteriota bacterium]|nr:amidohydrolase family protein [Acidobacteriota bacterium]